MSWAKVIATWRTRRRDSHEAVVLKFTEEIPWLSDEELGNMMDALESESVNRMANQAGYYDNEMMVWVDPV